MKLSAAKPIKLKNRLIETDLPAFVMGICNVTPDSFWSSSRKVDTFEAVEHILKMEKDGASIIDIGGESSRPNSQYISAEEEMERIIPVIEEVRKYTDCPISVDTRKKAVMEEALKAGADILNDISALQDDAEMAPFIAKADIPVILMHKKGNPNFMQNKENTVYNNVVNEVISFLNERITFALSCGIHSHNIMLDAGIGFGKTTEQNIQLIRECSKFAQLPFPFVMALSRKTCIGEVTGHENAADRLAGTLCANMYAVQNGASILRVHDVRETADMLKVLKAIYGD